ncbi:MAG: hypothetical protein DRO12_00380 [Thermoprotei archaeon]|nr:MAG: hypothetical protein DRO12_00380 [Thermoprotei archaeon]
MQGITVIIEHLESCLNRWILSEYSYVARLFRRDLVFTNVKDPRHRRALSELGKVVEKSVTEVLSNRDDVLVLDPWADQPLRCEDLGKVRYVVIGGIMGDNPPKRRTSTHISSKMPRAFKRSLGPWQFTIAGAAYVLKEVILGKELELIEVTKGIRIPLRLGRGIEGEIELPYAFPTVNGRPVLPEDYLKIVAEGMLLYEQRLLRGDEDVCYESA